MVKSIKLKAIDTTYKVVTTNKGKRKKLSEVDTDSKVITLPYKRTVNYNTDIWYLHPAILPELQRLLKEAQEYELNKAIDKGH